MPSRWLKPIRSDQFCHCSRLPSRVNDTPSGWVRCSGLSGSRRDAARIRSGMCLGTYSPMTVGSSDAAVVLDPQHLHRVDVDDAVQPADRMGVGTLAGTVLAPGVRPAEPSVAVLRRCDGVAVGPGVDEHQVQSVMPRLASAAMNVGMLAHQLVALEELVDGEVGLHAGDVVERLDAVVGQRHHALVGGVVGTLQADHLGATRREPPPAVEVGQFALGRFDEFDRSDPPAQVRVAAQAAPPRARAAGSPPPR